MKVGNTFNIKYIYLFQENLTKYFPAGISKFQFSFSRRYTFEMSYSLLVEALATMEN